MSSPIFAKAIVVVVTATMMMITPTLAVIGTYDPTLHYFIDELFQDGSDNTSIIDSHPELYLMDNVTQGNPVYPSMYHLSMFHDPRSDKDLSYMIGVAPLCFAFNLPGRRNQYFTSYTATWSNFFLGIETPLYTSDVFPTVAYNLSDWRFALPASGTALSKSLLDSLMSLNATLKSNNDNNSGLDGYPTMPKTSPYTVTSFPSEQDILQYVLGTPYSIGVMSNALAKEYLLPCLRHRARRTQQSDVVLAPRIVADNVLMYRVDVDGLSVGVRRPELVAYPFVGPIVFHVSRDYACTTPSTSSTDPTTTTAPSSSVSLEVVLYQMLEDEDVPRALRSIGGIRIGPYEQGLVLAQVQKNLCVHGRVIPVGGIESVVITEWASHYYTDHSTMLRINLSTSSLTNIDNVIQGQYRFAVVNLLPTRNQYKALPTLSVIPIVGTTYSIVFNIGESDLTLDINRCLLPRIFNGSIPYWNDTAIQRDNPSVILPKSRIRVVAQNVSDMNWVITQGLRAIDMHCNPHQTTTTMSNIVVSTSWPFKPWQYLLYAKDEDDVRATVAKTSNSIGFVMTSTAVDWEMTSLTLWDPASKSIMDAQEGLLRTMNTATVDKTTSEVLLNRTRGDIYPFVAISYVVYDTDPRLGPLGCGDQSSSTSFFEYMLLDSNADATARKYGYSSMPWGVRNDVIQRLHGEAKCDGQYIYPQPDTSENTQLRDIIIGIVAAVVVCVCAVFVWKWYSRRAVVRYAPKDTMRKFTTMMIALKKESHLWESFPNGMPTVTRRIDQVISRCARRSRCYRVKEIGSATMFVSVRPEECVALAHDVMVALAAEPLNSLLGDPIVLDVDSLTNDTPKSSNQCTKSQVGSNRSTPKHLPLTSLSERRDTVGSAVTTSHRGSMSTVREIPTVTFGIGIHEDVGRIMYNEAAHTYDYAGPSTDISAVTTDTAQGHQVLITGSSITDTFLENCTVEPFTTVSVGNKSLAVHQYNPPGLPVRRFEQPSEDSIVDSIATTLQQKSSGVAVKRVLTMMMCIEPVNSKNKSTAATDSTQPPTTEEMAKAYTHQIEVLGEAVSRSKGYIHGFVGGRAFVSFNAVYPTPQYSKRAFLCVDAVRTGLLDTTVSCALQLDSAVVGPFQMVVSGQSSSSSKSSNNKGHNNGSAAANNTISTCVEHHALITRAIDTTLTLHGRGVQHRQDMITIPSTLEDEFSTFAELEYVDFMTTTTGMIGIVSVRGMKQDNGEMDEWMYELEDPSNNSHSSNIVQRVNQVYRRLLQDPKSAETFAAAKEAFTTIMTGMTDASSATQTTIGCHTLQKVFGGDSTTLEEYFALLNRVMLLNCR
eukprot:PhF_6_TR1926/c1_g1_i4/m.2993